MAKPTPTMKTSHNIVLMDKVRVMALVDTHTTPISNTMSTQALFSLYASCFDVYNQHMQTSKATMHALGASSSSRGASSSSMDAIMAEASIDAVKAYLGIIHPTTSPVVSPAFGAPKACSSGVDVINSRVRTHRAMRGAYRA